MLTSLIAALTLLSGLTPEPMSQMYGGKWSFHHEVSGPESGAFFGGVVSGGADIDGDGSDDFLVGAAGANPLGIAKAGSVFAYSGATGTLLFRFDGTLPNAYLGRAVVLVRDASGDGRADMLFSETETTVNGIVNAGSVYLRSGADGSLLHRFDGVAAGDRLGVAVADAGDVDGDGLSDLMFSTTRRAVGGVDYMGVVLVHSGLTGMELHSFPGSFPMGNFGGSVAGAGDVDADGCDDLIVAASSTDVGGLQRAGSAFVYSGATGSLLHRFDGPTDGDQLGSSVSGAGDIDQDGAADLIMGASSGNGSRGAAFVHSGRTGAMLYQFNGTDAFGFFGHSVAYAGDVDRDGTGDLIIGAPEALQSRHAGSALIYSGATGYVIFQIYGADEDRLGTSVSGAGDCNADGFADVVFGVPRAEVGGMSDAGSVTVVGRNPWIRTNSFTISDGQNSHLRLELDFPAAAAGFFYRVLLSKSGRGPTLHGVNVPLTLDALMTRTYHGGYPAQRFRNMRGFLDVNGDAVASVGIHAGALSGMIGTTIHLAAIASPPGELPSYSTAAIPLTITP